MSRREYLVKAAGLVIGVAFGILLLVVVALGTTG